MSMNKRTCMAIAAATLPMLFNVALAGDAGGGDGEGFTEVGGALTAFADFITGDFAATVSLIALVIAGAVLIFGNDLSRFGQTIFYVILVIAIIVFAANIIEGLFSDGATLSGASRVLLATGALIAMAALLAAAQTALLGWVERSRARRGAIAS